MARKEDATAGQKTIPLGRWGTVREIADATVYLFSEAAGYVTGTTLVGEFGHLSCRSLYPLLKAFVTIGLRLSQCILSWPPSYFSYCNHFRDPGQSSASTQRRQRRESQL